MAYKNPNLKIILPKQNSENKLQISETCLKLEKECRPFFESFTLNDINFDKFVIYVIGKSYKLNLDIHSQKKYVLEYINYIIDFKNLNSKYIRYKVKNGIIGETVMDILILNKNRNKTRFFCFCC